MQRSQLWTTTGAVAILVLALPAGSVFYSAPSGDGCARCHEIQPARDDWRRSTHRSVSCSACHGDTLTLDASFHAGNLRRLVRHLRGETPEEIRIRDTRDLFKVVERCRRCHEQEYADWQAGPHGATYAAILLDKQHNAKRMLMDDCLRCHGMHFEGSIRDLVTPIDTRGPWKLTLPEMADRPVIPCVACHQIHSEGQPLRKPPSRDAATPGARQELYRPSLALYDRRELAHIPVGRLPLPAMREQDRPVKMSPDIRQALCYQCHAPLAGAQVGSGDDRTGIGVHEGISCLGCHQKHGQQTRASCAGCHPRWSNCGLDVEKMETTFVSPKSPHNIHFVKCVDCHSKGVPKKKPAAPLGPTD